MTIAIACDHAGRNLKQAIRGLLEDLGHTPLDMGGDVGESLDYPLLVIPLAEAVVAGKADLGIFLCGSGIGPAIAANKVPGVRAVPCHDVYSARSSRRDQNVNVLTMGERVIGIGAALEVAKVWLEQPWSEAPRHQRRLDQIAAAEQQARP